MDFAHTQMQMEMISTGFYRKVPHHRLVLDLELIIQLETQMVCCEFTSLPICMLLFIANSCHLHPWKDKISVGLQLIDSFVAQCLYEENNIVLTIPHFLTDLDELEILMSPPPLNGSIFVTTHYFIP